MKEKLNLHIPEKALSYCVELWQKYPFTFMLSAKRSTKLGDYRYLPKDHRHIITINNDLNPYHFLITYIHEVAHRITFEKYGRKVKPHGNEWKNTFKQLMLPVLTPAVFPEEILKPLAKYLKKPLATTHSCTALLTALRKHDVQKMDVIPLAELQIGQSFTFRKRTFEKLHTRRTRVVCREVISNRNYLISAMAEVYPSLRQYLLMI